MRKLKKRQAVNLFRKSKIPLKVHYPSKTQIESEGGVEISALGEFKLESITNYKEKPIKKQLYEIAGKKTSDLSLYHNEHYREAMKSLAESRIKFKYNNSYLKNVEIQKTQKKGKV